MTQQELIEFRRESLEYALNTTDFQLRMCNDDDIWSDLR